MDGLVDVVVPADHGEGSVARILRWLHLPGAQVRKDEPIVELETDKVTVEVPAPVTGEIVESLLPAGADVAPGGVLARLRAADESAMSMHSMVGTDEGVVTRTDRDRVVAPTSSAPSSAPERDRQHLLSPAVRRLLQQAGLHAADVPGSGRGGRIVRADFERGLRLRSCADGSRLSGAHEPAESIRVPHSPIRRRIAEHMVASLATAPHVTAVFEVDLSAVVADRARQRGEFESRGAHLTLTVYFISATVRALQAVPQINAIYHDDALELHRHCNIGIGTALGSEGLIVPVLVGAASLDLFGIALELGRLTEAARHGRLTRENVRGGTFTISNHGVSGSLIAAPVVINQPQIAILGIGRIEKRVVACTVDGQDNIAIRPMCYVTLTVDHRAVDAYQANAFLTVVKDTLERWPDATASQAMVDPPTWSVPRV